jgi:hypothetical protein
VAEPCSVRELELRVVQLELSRVRIEKDVEYHQELYSGERSATKAALDIATKGLDGHLLLLNGEADRLRLMQATYLPREVYAAEIKELRKDIIELREFKSNLLGRQSIISVVVSVAVSVVFLVINVIVNNFLRKP